MSVTTEADELPVLLEELNNDGEKTNNIGTWLQGIATCFLISLLGLIAFNPKIFVKFKLLKVNLGWWVILGLVIISATLVSYLIVKFTLYLLTLSRFCRVRILFFVAEEKNTLQAFFCSIIVFMVGYVLLYHPTLNQSENVKSQFVIWCLLLVMIGCFAWLVMSILLKLHQMTCLNQIYFDRVKKLILERCILRMLMSSSPELQNHEISQFNDLIQLTKKDITARITDKLINMVGDESLPSVEVVVTKSILRNIVELSSSSNHVDKIKKFLIEQSALTINFFDGDEINENTLHLWVVAVYRDRQALLSNMGKTNTAIINQHLIVRIGVLVIFIISMGFTIYHKIKKDSDNEENNTNEFTQFNHSL